MLYSKRSVISTIALTSTVAITAFVAMKSTESFEVGGKLPDDFKVNRAEKIQLTQITTAGDVKYVLNADLMVRYADSDSKLSQVDLVTYSNNKDKPWHIRSDTADIIDDNDKINLYDHVIVSRDGNGKESPPVKITTTFATVYPKRDYVESDKLVTMTEPGSDNVMTGVGLQGNLNPAKIKLMSDVRTYYVGQDQK